MRDTFGGPDGGRFFDLRAAAPDFFQPPSFASTSLRASSTEMSPENAMTA